MTKCRGLRWALRLLFGTTGENCRDDVAWLQIESIFLPSSLLPIFFFFPSYLMHFSGLPLLIPLSNDVGLWNITIICWDFNLKIRVSMHNFMSIWMLYYEGPLNNTQCWVMVGSHVYFVQENSNNFHNRDYMLPWKCIGMQELMIT